MNLPIFTMLCGVGLCGGVYAQGSNSCGTAQAILGTGTFAYDTTSATTDGAPDPVCYKFGNSQIDTDVWFSWTATGSGAHLVSMCAGGALDTKIAIYAGAGCASPMVDCDDDTCGLLSEVTHPSVLAGNTYLLRIGTFPGGTTSAGTFDISNLGGPPPNDACMNAAQIGGCGSFAFDNYVATQDGLPDPMCYKFGTSQIDADVWYHWTAPNTGSFTANTCAGAGNDTKMAVYSALGACPAANALDCNDDTCGLQSQVTWNATCGDSYLIRLGSFPGGSTGAGFFDITGCAPPVGTNYCASTPNSTGAPSIISGTGSPSIAANDLFLTANNLPPGQPGIFIAGPNPAMAPFYCGFLCIDFGRLQRFSITAAPGPNGVICERVNYLTAAPGGLNVFIGVSHHYQRWNRDPGGAATCAGPGSPSNTANFSDGLRVVHTP